ncbi:MAG: ATP-binding protein [Candidatus Obscuribacterales bacterium]
MKLNIAHKLMMIMMLTTGIVVGLIFGLTRFSILSGFTNYVERVELSTLSTFAGNLARRYERGGNSWDFARNDESQVWWILGASEMSDLHHNVPPPPGELPNPHPPPGSGPPLEAPGGGPPFLQFLGAPPGTKPGTMPPSFPEHRMAFFRRIGLFDQSGKIVWGNLSSRNSKQMLALTAGGKQIGYLKLVPNDLMSKDIEGQFIAEQSRNLLIVSAVAFLAAVGAAFLLSHDLVRAINTLVQGTRKLSTGNFETRISLNRGDELGELAEDFNSLANTLQQQDTAKKQWITDTSHELRTPIAILRAQVEAFQDGVQQVNPRTLEILHSEIITLGKLVDDLHDLARSDLGQLRYDFVPVDVGVVLLDTVEAFNERFASKKIKLDASAVADLHCIVEADSTRLTQVFSNLLENSLRYTNENGGVKISSMQLPGELAIYFDDSEPGVSAQSISQIFDRFYRSESSRNRKHGGAGLGLPICKAVIEAHHGTLTSTRSQMGGLRITIRLPLKELSKW